MEVDARDWTKLNAHTDLGSGCLSREEYRLGMKLKLHVRSRETQDLQDKTMRRYVLLIKYAGIIINCLLDRNLDHIVEDICSYLSWPEFARLSISTDDRLMQQIDWKKNNQSVDASKPSLFHRIFRINTPTDQFEEKYPRWDDFDRHQISRSLYESNTDIVEQVEMCDNTGEALLMLRYKFFGATHHWDLHSWTNSSHQIDAFECVADFNPSCPFVAYKTGPARFEIRCYQGMDELLFRGNLKDKMHDSHEICHLKWCPNGTRLLVVACHSKISYRERPTSQFSGRRLMAERGPAWKKNIFIYNMGANKTVHLISNDLQEPFSVSSLASTNHLWLSSNEILLPGVIENSRAVYVGHFDESKKKMELCRVMLDYCNPFYGVKSEISEEVWHGNSSSREFKENLCFVGCMFAIPEKKDSSYYHMGPTIGMLASCDQMHLHDRVYLYSATSRHVYAILCVPGRILSFETAIRNNRGCFAFVYAFTNAFMEEGDKEVEVNQICDLEIGCKKFIRHNYIKKCNVADDLYNRRFGDSCNDDEETSSPPTELSIFYLEKTDLCPVKLKNVEHVSWLCSSCNFRTDCLTHSETKIA